MREDSSKTHDGTEKTRKVGKMVTYGGGADERMSEGEAAIKFMEILGSYLIENFPEEVEKHQESKSPVDLAILIIESMKTIN